MIGSFRFSAIFCMEKMIKVAKIIFLTLLFIAGITFSMENTDSVVLKYYFGMKTLPIPVFLLVMFSVLLGVLLAGVVFILDERSLKRAAREKEREIATLERELKSFSEPNRAPAGMGTREQI